jgi:hypothetical protein
MDDIRRKALQVLAAMSEVLVSELESLIGVEEKAIKGRHGGDQAALDCMRDALEGLEIGAARMREAGEPRAPAEPARPWTMNRRV